MSKEGNHHFIPIFYLKQWAGSDHKICEYKQRYHGVLPRRVFPAATGYVRGLYSVPRLSPQYAQYVEKRFMQCVDDKASIALKALLNGNLQGSNSDLLNAWASFVHSLTLRSPEGIESLHRAIKGKAGILAERVQFAASEALPTLVTSPLLIGQITSMAWMTVNVEDAKHSLLTSDCPVIRTSVLSHHGAYLIVPISPRKILVATNTNHMFREIQSIAVNALV